MALKNIPDMAFSVENGNYEYVRMPFGFQNELATFQLVTGNIFGVLLNS